MTRNAIRSCDLSSFVMTDMSQRLGVSRSYFDKRLRSVGVSWMELRKREQLDRLLEALDDAPESEPDFLARLLGFSWTTNFLKFFTVEMGKPFNVWRQGYGLAPVRWVDIPQDLKAEGMR